MMPLSVSARHFRLTRYPNLKMQKKRFLAFSGLYNILLLLNFFISTVLSEMFFDAEHDAVVRFPLSRHTFKIS